jgi:hypothetical protein
MSDEEIADELQQLICDSWFPRAWTIGDKKLMKTFILAAIKKAKAEFTRRISRVNDPFQWKENQE